MRISQTFSLLSAVIIQINNTEKKALNKTSAHWADNHTALTSPIFFPVSAIQYSLENTWRCRESENRSSYAPKYGIPSFVIKKGLFRGIDESGSYDEVFPFAFMQRSSAKKKSLKI